MNEKEHSEELKLKIEITMGLLEVSSVSEKLQELVLNLVDIAFIEGQKDMLERIEKTTYTGDKAQ